MFGDAVDLRNDQGYANNCTKASAKQIGACCVPPATVDGGAQLLVEVEEMFLRQSASSQPAQRLAAATGLSFYTDAAARERLKEMAAGDPEFTVTRLAHKRQYDVRNVASLALKGPVDTGDMK